MPRRKRVVRKKKLAPCLVELAEKLPLTLPRADAAKVLCLSLRTFDRAVQVGELTAIKASGPAKPGKSKRANPGRVMVTRSELLRWMTERLTQKGPVNQSLVNGP